MADLIKECSGRRLFVFKCHGTAISLKIQKYFQCKILKHLVWCLMFQSERNINVLVSDTDCEELRMVEIEELKLRLKDLM